MRADPSYFHRQLRHTPKQHQQVPLHQLTAHFTSVFQGQGLGPHAQGEQDRQPASEAEAAHVFNEETVGAVIKHLSNKATPGADGLSGQFYKVPELRNHLIAVLRLIYQVGVEPEEMNIGLLVAAYKGRGSLWDALSYRPLVISTVLHKVYAGCIKLASILDLGSRLDEVLPTQAGFLPKRNTMLNCFLLQHAVQHAHHIRQPLHVALLDVAKAYDTVNHAVLLTALAGVQLPAHLITAVAGMYTGLAYMVTVDGRLGDRVAVGKGVKQGCPLSPLLYNLYVAAVVGWLKDRCPGMGLQLAEGEQRQPLYLYADDQMVAHAGERQVFQQGLDELSGFMQGERDQKMNAAKSVELVTTVPQAAPATVGGEPIMRKYDTVYLGLLYDTKASCEAMAKHRTQAFTGAAIAGWSGLRAAGCALPQTPQSLLKVLHTRAEPAGLYGSELWGVQYAAVRGPQHMSRQARQAAFYSLDDPLEKQRCATLRKWFRLPHDVPKVCMLHELGCVPLVHAYVNRAARLFNNLLRAGAVWRSALQQNVQDGLGGNHPAQNWAAHLYSALHLIAPHQQWRSRMLQLQPLDLKVVRLALQQFYTDYCQRLSPVTLGEGSRKGTYFRTVGIHTLGRLPTYLRKWLPGQQVHHCMLFRLGCHQLRVRTGHFSGQPRELRQCQRCGSTDVDDEMHCIHRCEHPQLVAVRNSLKAAVPVSMPSGRLPLLFRYFEEGDRDSIKLRRVVQFVADCYRISKAAYEQGQGGQPEQLVEQEEDSGDELLEVSDEPDPIGEELDRQFDMHEIDGGLEPGTQGSEADEEGPELQQVG
jgi:hypothetical protein